MFSRQRSLIFDIVCQGKGVIPALRSLVGETMAPQVPPSLVRNEAGAKDASMTTWGKNEDMRTEIHLYNQINSNNVPVFNSITLLEPSSSTTPLHLTAPVCASYPDPHPVPSIPAATVPAQSTCHHG